jgi:arylsulfatase A-like enzyme
MGDHWMFSKLGFYDASYYVPMIIRDPRMQADTTRGTVVNAFTENVDVMPTMLDWLNLEIPSQCDGSSLMPFIYGEHTPSQWRTEAHWEYDFRDTVNQGAESSLGITSHQCNLTVIRSERYKYVHFTALPPLMFDLENDPGELHNVAEEPEYQELLITMLQKMMSWRMNHTSRGLTETFLTGQGPVQRISPLR